MRTRLVFVRHGESVHAVRGIVGGPRGCQGLTEVGREQARRLAARLTTELGGDGPIGVYSSVLRRAVETAAPVAAALGTTAVEDCGLCTWHIPAYADGLPGAEHALEGGGVFRPASVTEWSADQPPTSWPPVRWTLHRFNELAS
jgi:probable phosphoglycerate mutase